MRELDAWIAEHVMGYRWYKFSDGVFQLEVPGDWQKRHGGIQVDRPTGTEIDATSAPKYATDPAAAMQVLEKCCKQTAFPISIGVKFGGWYCGQFKDLAGAASATTSSTLPIAICLFAKKLFSK